MDTVQSVFRVILELSNDRASSTVYFMLLASCMTARTRYLRLKSNSSEVVEALKENESAVVRLDSISGTSVKVYYLDGYHMSVDVANDTTLKEICEKLLHDTRMGLYEVENEFGPSHEQRLLDADMTVAHLSARWKNKKWPHAKLIAPFYLKGWTARSPPHEQRHVRFDHAHPAVSSQANSPPAEQPNDLVSSQSPQRLTGQVTTPEKMITHSPSSTSPHRRSPIRHQSPGTTARTRTHALIDVLFNTGEEMRPRVEFINRPPASPVTMPKPVFGTPPRTEARTVTVAFASPTTNSAEVPSNGDTSALKKRSPHRRSPALVRSPSQSATTTPSPSNGGSINSSSAKSSRRQGRPTNLQAIPLRSSSSYATTLNTVTNARGAYSPVTPVVSGLGSVSSSSSTSSNGSVPANDGRSPESTTQTTSTSQPSSPMGASVSTPASAQRVFAEPSEVAVHASPVRDAATSPITVLDTVSSPFHENTSTTVRTEAAVVVPLSQKSAPNTAITSNEKIRPRTTYVPIAGSAGNSPVDPVVARRFYSSAEASNNVFDLNNSPALLPVPVSIGSTTALQSHFMSSDNAAGAREEDSPTTTESTHSGASTPGSVGGLSPYPSWRVSPFSGNQASGPGRTSTTPPETINSVLFARLFGRPELNEFSSPRFAAAANNTQRHSSPHHTRINKTSPEETSAQSRYSRSSSPAGSVCSVSDNSVSSGGTRRTRGRSNSQSVRPPFDTTYSSPPVSQLIVAHASSGERDDQVSYNDSSSGMANLIDDMAAATLDEGDCLTPLPSEHTVRHFATPKNGASRRNHDSNNTGSRATPNASRRDRNTTSGAISESDSSVASHSQTRLPRRSAHNTPVSTNAKKHKNSSTPASASTGTGGKTKRTSLAAFGHGLRSPTSAAIRELFEARKAHNAASNGMPSAEQIAAGFYTQSYAQLHGGYMPPKRVFRPKHTVSDNEHSQLDSDSGSLRSGRHPHSHAHASEESETANKRQRARGRSTSPHSVISNASSKGSRASSANRKRVAHNWVP